MKTRQRSQQATLPAMPVGQPNLAAKRVTKSPPPGPPEKRRTFGIDITNALQSVTIQSAKKVKDTKSIGVIHEECFRSKIVEEFANISAVETISPQHFLNSQPSTVSQPESNASREAAIALSQGSSSSDSDAETRKRLEASELPPALPTSQPPSQDPQPPIYDYDKENDLDPFNVPQYAQHIFSYYRSRESSFTVSPYLLKQKEITRHMRAILVDWMVEVQENFELNHETLYQAVKIVDLFLDRHSISKEDLQLLGATALFISCKFDERSPPLADDFVYICDDAYTRDQLIDMEQTVLKTLEFDIGFPLSYRFLRRYAKACKASMETLTLARYILETSLLHYEFVTVSESAIAAAAFLLAIRIRDHGEWTQVHARYSGYEEQEIEPLMWRLNRMIRTPSKTLHTVQQKYSHEVFYKVAMMAPLIDPFASRTSTPKSSIDRDSDAADQATPNSAAEIELSATHV